MMKKILVPIDGSDISLRAMNFAIELGKHFASEIVVLNVDIPYDLSRIKPAVKDKDGNEIELKDDDEDTYQPDRIRDDDFYGYNAGGESDFAAAGFTLKEGSDDDDLAVADDTDDADEDVGFEEEIVLDDSTDDGDLD